MLVARDGMAHQRRPVTTDDGVSQMTNQAQDRQLLEQIRQLFNDRIPFNRVLGLRIDSLDYDHPRVRFDMRPELVGNFLRGNLHGGVISAALDVTGGLAAFLGVQKRLSDEPLDAKLERFGQLGTIDLRIDYLRPGIGEYFTAHAEVMRLGSRVATTRMEFRDAEGKLISTGSGAYIVS